MLARVVLDGAVLPPNEVPSGLPGCVIGRTDDDVPGAASAMLEGIPDIFPVNQVRHLLVDLAPVPDDRDEDHLRVVVGNVEDPPITHPNAPRISTTLELLRSMGPRGVGKAKDGLVQSGPDDGGGLVEGPFRPRLEEEAIGHGGLEAEFLPDLFRRDWLPVGE